MRVSVKRTDVYIPEWNGNRKLPESEQVRVHYHFLSFEEQEQIVSVDNSGNTKLNFAAGVSAQVDKVENLTIDVDGKDVQIKTGADLVNNAAVDRLALEVWRHLNAVDPMSAATTS